MCTRAAAPAAAVAVRGRRWGRCSIYRHRSASAACAAQNAQNFVFEIIKAQFVEITQINNSLLLFTSNYKYQNVKINRK